MCCIRYVKNYAQFYLCIALIIAYMIMYIGSFVLRNVIYQDTKLNRLRKEFLDPRSPTNLKRLNDDLSEIQLIMRTNIQDVLQRGEKLESVPY